MWSRRVPASPVCAVELAQHQVGAYLLNPGHPFAAGVAQREPASVPTRRQQTLVPCGQQCTVRAQRSVQCAAVPTSDPIWPGSCRAGAVDCIPPSHVLADCRAR
jgi:hypothetical protein